MSALDDALNRIDTIDHMLNLAFDAYTIAYRELDHAARATVPLTQGRVNGAVSLFEKLTLARATHNQITVYIHQAFDVLIELRNNLTA